MKKSENNETEMIQEIEVPDVVGKTEEQAKILLDECDKQEMLWISGEKITDKTHWNMYTTNTCYHIEDKRIAYADLDYFYEQDMKVYDFKDVFK